MTDGQTFSSCFPASGTYYDLLAALCFSLSTLGERTKQKAYQLVTGNPERYRNSAAKEYPFLSNRGYERLTLYSDLRYEDARRILNLLDNVDNESSASIVLGIIMLVENLLDTEHNLSVFLSNKRCTSKEMGDVSDTYFAFEGLNEKTLCIYGRLIPRERCSWARGKERNPDTVAQDPLSFLKKHIWIAPTHDYSLVNLYTDFNIPEGRGLRVVFSPLMDKAPFQTVPSQDLHTYEVQYDQSCIQQISKRIKAVIDWAIQENADIVFFPELMASQENIEECRTFIKEKWNCKNPHLLLLPTTERQNDGNWINQLTALDDAGNEIFSYHKQHPFQWDIKEHNSDDIIAHRFEPIVADNIVYVLHAPGIGRIGFLICSDVFKPGYLEYLLQQLKLTVLLHSTFSAGKELMVRKLQQSVTASCDVVLCNTCAAWDQMEKPINDRNPVTVKENDFIYAYFPSGHKMHRMCTTNITCSERACTGCGFFLELATSYTGSVVPPTQMFLGE